MSVLFKFLPHFKLVPYQPRIDVYKYSFLPRTVPEWNRLDAEIIETDCVEEFKQKLAPFYVYG